VQATTPRGALSSSYSIPSRKLSTYAQVVSLPPPAPLPRYYCHLLSPPDIPYKQTCAALWKRRSMSPAASGSSRCALARSSTARCAALQVYVASKNAPESGGTAPVLRTKSDMDGRGLRASRTIES
jgi:hypothetical protein